MNVFISFSGSKSHDLAEIIRQQIDVMFDVVKPFLSGRDIESGARWQPEITGQLKESNYGILCLLPDNLTSEWIHFEAGSLGKHTDGRVCSVLFDGLKPLDVTGPLEQFQNCEFNESNISKLFRDINNACDSPVSEEVFKERFGLAWPRLSKECANVLAAAPKSDTDEGKRADRELLEEAVYILRDLHNKSVNASNVAQILAAQHDEKQRLLSSFLRGSLHKPIGPSGNIFNTSKSEYKLSTSGQSADRSREPDESSDEPKK